VTGLGDHDHRHRAAARRGADAAGGAGPTLDPTSGRNMAYALGTLALIVIIQRVFTGFMATVAVLVGLVVGTLVAVGAGRRALRRVGHLTWLGVTTPFYFGWPKFAFAAILSMIVVMLITAVETTGDVFATGEIVEKRIGKGDIARALRADGLATTIGGVLNSFPYTCFAENVGLVRLTRVKSRYVVATAGLIMIVLGLLPKAAAIVAGIPHPVLGGAALAMFATVAVVGIQTLSRVDFHDHRNVVIVGTSIGLAMYVTAQPDVAKAVPEWAQIILGSGITAGQHHRDPAQPGVPPRRQDFGPAVAGTPGCLHPAGPGQRDVPRRVRPDLLPACSRARTGCRAGLRAAAVQRHAGPAARVPGGPVRRVDRGAGAADRGLPGPRRAVGGDRRRGHGVAGRPVRHRAQPARREGARRAGRASPVPTATASAFPM
jgi:hypothetical protein